MLSHQARRQCRYRRRRSATRPRSGVVGSPRPVVERRGEEPGTWPRRGPGRGRGGRPGPGHPRVPGRPGDGDLHPLVGERLQLRGGAVVVAGRLVGDQPGDEVRRHGLEHGVRAELGVVGEDHDLRGGLDEGPVDGCREHVGGGQPAFGGQAAPGEEGLGHPQALQGPARRRSRRGRSWSRAGVPPVITTSTRLAWANAWATRRELVTTVRPGTRAPGGGPVPAWSYPPRPRSPRLLRRGPRRRSAMAVFLGGREMGFLRKAGLPRESARQYRTAVPAVEESLLPPVRARPAVRSLRRSGRRGRAHGATRHRSLAPFRGSIGDVQQRTRN